MPRRLFLASLLLCLRPASGCDSCSLFVATAEGHRGFSFAVAEQFTRMGTVWQGSRQLPNPAEQFLESSTTQFVAAYAPTNRWQYQVAIPYVARRYVRPEHAEIDRGRVSGIGDSTLSTRYVAFRRDDDRTAVSIAALGGVEFGTGNATHLGDEIGHHFHHHAGFPDSGVHGHDLALGSGSTDYLLGGDANWRGGRNFVRGALQYRLRRPGKFGYRFADETAWEAGVGRYVVLTEQHSLSAQAMFSAEHKGFDRLGGVAQVDTGFSAHFVGARAVLTMGERFAGELSAELPVRIRTSEVMVVPDYRLRFGLTWRH